MPSTYGADTKASVQFYALAAFLTLVFFTGGASRIDVLSLVILRPAAALLCALALITITRDHLRAGRGLLIGMAAIMLLVALHLIPLPPFLWQNMPGRAELAAMDDVAGLGDVWRPLSLSPINGWHALFSLFTPLAVLLLGIQLGKEDLRRLLVMIIAMGVISGIFGALQLVLGADSFFYLYRITNDDTAVGLFANRNHAALMLAMMFPFLGVWAATPTGSEEHQHGRRIAAVAIGLFLIPLVLMTGSRGGVIFALFGLAAVPLLYRKPHGSSRRRATRALSTRGLMPIAVGLLAIMLAAIALFAQNSGFVQRLMDSGVFTDNRSQQWVVTLDLLWKYLPFGSGAGSFVEVYQTAEPDAMLTLQYLNHAHSDWLEIALTFGVPGMVLMGIAVFAYFRRTWALLLPDTPSRGRDFARLAAVMLLMMGFASFPDYPVRTPIMMALMAIACLWFAAPSDQAETEQP
jgi:O-antigen ligase